MNADSALAGQRARKASNRSRRDSFPNSNIVAFCQELIASKQRLNVSTMRTPACGLRRLMRGAREPFCPFSQVEVCAHVQQGSGCKHIHEQVRTPCLALELVQCFCQHSYSVCATRLDACRVDFAPAPTLNHQEPSSASMESDRATAAVIVMLRGRKRIVGLLRIVVHCCSPYIAPHA